MANRAYLYFDSDLESIGKKEFRNSGNYIDSRHNIPLAWWFYFDLSDVKISEVKIHGDHWKEIQVVSDWEAASNRFSKRISVVESLTNKMITLPDIQKMHDDLQKLSKKYVALDPSEIFQDELNVDERRVLKIFTVLENKMASLDEISNSINPYSQHRQKPIGLDIRAHLLGCFYE